MTGESQEQLARRRVTRRRVLKAGGTLAATTGLPSVAAAQSNPDFGGWFDDTDNYSGIVDKRGESSVTVTVGADGNKGPYAFAPAAVRVDPGTKVTFEWVSDTHNILIESAPEGSDWGGVEAIKNTGFTHEHTFETEGVFKYYCKPHLPLGMKGAVVVGDVEVTSGGDGGGRGPAGGFTLPGSPTEQTLMLVLLGGCFLSAMVALLPEIIGLPGAVRRRLSGGAYWVNRRNSFRNRPVGSAVVGLVSVLVVLDVVGGFAVGLWALSGGGAAFVGGLVVASLLVVLYAKSVTGVTVLPGPVRLSRPRLTSPGIGFPGRNVSATGSGLRRVIPVVKGWIGVGVVLTVAAAGAAGLRTLAGSWLVFLVVLAVTVVVVAWYAVDSGQ